MSTNAKDRIDEVAEIVESRIRGLFDEARDQILEAINAVVEDAQDAAENTEKGKEAVVSIPISVKWNLDRNAVKTELSVTVKRKFGVDDTLEDPAQPALPGTEGAKGAKGAVRKLAQLVRDGKMTITVNGGKEGGAA